MSTWRRKAIELFPDLRRDIDEPDANAMSVFFELLPRVREAHQKGDDAELRKIYGFASWCAREKSKDLWNAAYVAFYEHLVDQQNTRQAIPEWVPPDIFENALSLFAWRLTDDSDFGELVRIYNRQRKTKFSVSRGDHPMARGKR